MRLILGAVASLAMLAVLGAIAPSWFLAQTLVPATATAVPRPSSAPLQVPVRPEAPKAGTAVVRGRVLAAASGVPLRRAQLRLSRVGVAGTGLLAGTDDQGRYEYNNLAPGQYTLTAEKSGYVLLSYGQHRPLDAGRTLEVVDGQVLERIDLALPTGSDVVVHVTDDLGEPFAGARVQLEEYRFVNGERRLAAVDNATSDDVGVARLSGIMPGDYYVSANPNLVRVTALGANDSRRMLAPTYHPDATSVAEARRVSVSLGQEVSVDVALAAVRTAQIRGSVRSVSGAPVRGILSLQTQPTVSLLPGPTATIQADGSFAFANVAPGSYTIRMPAVNNIAAMNPNFSAEYASVPVTVTGDDLSGIVVTTSPGATVHGRITFDTGSPPVGIRREFVQLAVAFTGDSGPGLGRFTPNEDWTFQISGIVGRGVLRLRLNVMERNYSFLKSITLDGKDVTDTVFDFGTGDIGNLEVVLTQKQTEVIGSVVDTKGALINEFVAVIFSRNRDLWGRWSRFIAAGRPDQQGRFKIRGLPAGDYFAIAVPLLEEGEEQDVERLQRLQRDATRITLAENEVKTVDLRLVP